MKKYVKGEYIELTAEEMAKMAKEQTEAAAEPTVVERLEAIEAAILEGVLTSD